MSKISTVFTLSWIFMFFCLGSFSPAFAGEGEIDLEIKGQIMSAELEGVPFRMIFEKLKREKGIWCKGGEPVLEETVSVRFENLPLEEGLRRILSGINHVLFFDREKGLVGLFIIDKKESRRAVPGDEPPAIEKGLPSRPVEGTTLSGFPFDASPHPFRLATPKTKSTGTTTGENLPFPQDSHTENTDEPSVKRFPPMENPFTQRNPFTQKIPPSSENPFDENDSPSPENPFPDPFGAFRDPQKGRIGENCFLSWPEQCFLLYLRSPTRQELTCSVSCASFAVNFPLASRVTRLQTIMMSVAGYSKKV